MKWQGYRRSTNVSDKRGMGGMVAGGGIGAVVLAVVAMLLGVNPGDIIPPGAQQPGAPPPANDSASQFVSAVLASTEDMWSEVFGDDMFSRFEEEGVTNPDVGMAYRREVLEKGGSVDADEMLTRFLGREPDNTAFLRKLGIE